MRSKGLVAVLTLALAACAAPRPRTATRPSKRLSPAEGEFQKALELYDGVGLPEPDYEEGFRLFRKAAEGGIVDSHLGYMYEVGQGVPQDETEAARWYRKAAEAGQAEAQRRLGILYEEGRGLSGDKVEAYLWLGRAAAQGDLEAAQRRDRLSAALAPEQLAEAQKRLEAR